MPKWPSTIAVWFFHKKTTQNGRVRPLEKDIFDKNLIFPSWCKYKWQVVSRVGIAPLKINKGWRGFDKPQRKLWDNPQTVIRDQYQNQHIQNAWVLLLLFPFQNPIPWASQYHEPLIVSNYVLLLLIPFWNPKPWSIPRPTNTIVMSSSD